MTDNRPIGIFDSGVGGLTVAAQIEKLLPAEDVVYFGDTARVPYGTKSKETVTRFSVENVEFLMKRDVKIVIVACNTASADALRKIQQQYLLKHFPNRRVLGVIIPTAEEALRSGAKKIGILATQGTVDSGAYIREIKKINPRLIRGFIFFPKILRGVSRKLPRKFRQEIRRRHQSANARPNKFLSSRLEAR